MSIAFRLAGGAHKGWCVIIGVLSVLEAATRCGHGEDILIKVSGLLFGDC